MELWFSLGEMTRFLCIVLLAIKMVYSTTWISFSIVWSKPFLCASNILKKKVYKRKIPFSKIRIRLKYCLMGMVIDKIQLYVININLPKQYNQNVFCAQNAKEDEATCPGDSGKDIINIIQGFSSSTVFWAWKKCVREEAFSNFWFSKVPFFGAIFQYKIMTMFI